MVQDSRLVRPRKVTARGSGLTSRAGLVWLAGVADGLGLSAGLRAALAGLSWRDHHPGRTVALLVLAIADGATAMSDLVMLRGLGSVFGPVASTATLWRTLTRVGSVELRAMWNAERSAREAAWAREPARSRIVIDIDATIVTTRSDKQDAAGTWKRSFGFHPLVAVDIERREVLFHQIRPGNAGSNTAVDHISVLAAAIDALPEGDRVGHRPGDNADQVVTDLVVRTDTAGQSHWFIEECRWRNVGFSVGHQIDDRVRTAIMASLEADMAGAWQPALDRDGRARDGAEVAELTDWVNLDAWPPGTRLIVRRERPHPGAQLSLLDCFEGMRHTALLTDTAGDPALVELAHRNRGAAEGVIRDLKACGYAKWPSADVVTNEAWTLCTIMAFNLLSRAQRLTLTGPLRKATPKTIRNRLLHIAGRITPTGRILHLDTNWPWTPTLHNAINQPPTVTNHAA